MDNLGGNMKRLLLAAVSTAAIILTSCTSTKGNVNTTAKSGFSNVPSTGSVIPFTTLETTSDNVKILNGGYGSDACAHPTDKSMFYLITDRGPNIDYKGSKGKGKLFPVPNFTPKIGLFQIQNNGSVKHLKTIELKNPNGKLITGLPNPKGKGATGEIAYDLDGNILGTDDYGLDSEGIVALKDGTFWLSDEYGPHMVHYSAEGIELERVSPYGIDTGKRKLPAVFAKRRSNRGMEGLTVMPNQKTLVGIMQSTIYNPSKKEVVNQNIVRIVTFNTQTAKTKQYLYLQDEGTDSCSGITALNEKEFIVIERDGNFSGEGVASKKLYKINLQDATDVTGDVQSSDGMMINGKTLEQCTTLELNAAGIKFVKKELLTDLVKSLPNKYPHDKLEGVFLIDANTIAVTNDNDFALNVKDNKLVQKYLPGTNTVDEDMLYVVKIK